MGLYGYQQTIRSNIFGEGIISIAAPRQNGKTHAAIASLPQTRRSLYVTSGFRLARNAYDKAHRYHFASVEKARCNSGEMSLTFSDGGRVDFLTYNKNGARGLITDLIIFDDADMADADLLPVFAPCLFHSDHATIVGISVTPDRGLAKVIHDRADIKFVWADEDAVKANPGYGTLIKPHQLEFARTILPEDAFRREHLGLAEVSQ